MKKFTLLFLMLPNLFFANDLSSDEDFEFTVVKNTKLYYLIHLPLKLAYQSNYFSLKGIQNIK